MSSFSAVPPCTKVPTWRLSASTRAILVPARCFSETCCAIPKTVYLGTVSVSSLKFASITNAVLADRVTVSSLRCVSSEDWRVLGLTLESVRAGKIPSIEFGPVPRILKEEGSAPSPFPVSPLLPVFTGVPVTRSRAPSQTTFCFVKWAPQFGGWLGPARPSFPPSVAWVEGCVPFTRRENSEGSALPKLIVVSSVVLDGVVKRKFSVLEIYVGPSSV